MFNEHYLLVTMFVYYIFSLRDHFAKHDVFLQMYMLRSIL